MLEPSIYWGIVKIYTTDAKGIELGIVMAHHLKARSQQSYDSMHLGHDVSLI